MPRRKSSNAGRSAQIVRSHDEEYLFKCVIAIPQHFDIQCPMNMFGLENASFNLFGPHASEYGRPPWRSTRDEPSGEFGEHVHEEKFRDEFLILERCPS